jgi:hypothetical protein
MADHARMEAVGLRAFRPRLLSKAHALTLLVESFIRSEHYERDASDVEAALVDAVYELRLDLAEAERDETNLTRMLRDVDARLERAIACLTFGAGDPGQALLARVAVGGALEDLARVHRQRGLEPTEGARVPGVVLQASAAPAPPCAALGGRLGAPT